MFQYSYYPLLRFRSSLSFPSSFPRLVLVPFIFSSFSSYVLIFHFIGRVLFLVRACPNPSSSSSCFLYFSFLFPSLVFLIRLIFYQSSFASPVPPLAFLSRVIFSALILHLYVLFLQAISLFYLQSNVHEAHQNLFFLVDNKRKFLYDIILQFRINFLSTFCVNLFRRFQQKYVNLLKYHHSLTSRN